MSLPQKMREPRKCRATNGTAEAWYYLNPRSIDVLAEIVDGNNGARWITTCRLTRRQLQQALEIMETV
jgi:hypothetical protein